jgi:LCP family protein required for cell wall assembly
MPSRPDNGASRGAFGASEALPPLPAHLDPRGRHRYSESSPGWGRKQALVAVQLISAILSVFLVVTFGLYWWKYHSFSSNLQRLSIFGAAVDKPSHDIDGKDQNILIVGNDDRETATDAELKQLGTTRDGGSLNTDTMMLVHVPKDGTKAALISFPRDSYVNIPGYGMDKLNAAYPDGYRHANGSADAKRTAGAQLLVRTIQDLTGLTIDHFVQVDLLGFYRISNAIGGVRVNMCASVKEPDSGIDLHQGINTVKGTQALAFVRQRYNFPNGLGDLDRVQRQRYFLTASFRKLTSAGTLLNPVKLQNLLDAVQSSLYMDAQLDPLNLARQMQDLSADNIVGQTIPTDGFGTSSAGTSIVRVNPSEVKAFIQKMVGPTDNALTNAKPGSPSSVTVDVLNAGSGIDQAAATSAGVLRQAGFSVAQVDNASDADKTDTTVIEYSDGQQSQAKTVGEYVPGAQYRKVDGLSHVRVLLGSDGLKAVAKTAGSSGASSSSASTSSAPAAAPKPKAIDAGCIN